MKYGDDLVRQVRSMMGPGNPAPRSTTVGNWQDPQAAQIRERVLAQARDAAPGTLTGLAPDRLSGPAWPPWARRPDRGQPRPARPRRHLAWRLIAPAMAALAVAGLVTGLTLAGSSAGRPATGALAGGAHPPGFYVTVTYSRKDPVQPGFYVAVRDSVTGRVLSAVRTAPTSAFFMGQSVTADGSGRAFLLALPRSYDNPEVDLYQLRVSASGHTASLKRLKLALLSRSSPNAIVSLALSPDGTRLAASIVLNPYGAALRPHAEIAVYSLTGGAKQVWTAPADLATPGNLSWTGDNQLTFAWTDHIKVTHVKGGIGYAGRTQVRVLDTTAPGHSLLSSQALVTGGGRLGFIQGMLAGRGISPLLVTTYRNIPSGRASGTAILQTIRLSATGKVIKVLVRRAVPYRTLLQMDEADSMCNAYSLDAAGQHALISCARLGWLGPSGAFTPLPNIAALIAAAWG